MALEIGLMMLARHPGRYPRTQTANTSSPHQPTHSRTQAREPQAYLSVHLSEKQRDCSRPPTNLQSSPLQ